MTEECNHGTLIGNPGNYFCYYCRKSFKEKSEGKK